MLLQSTIHTAQKMIKNRREIIEEAVKEVLGDKRNVTFIVKER